MYKYEYKQTDIRHAHIAAANVYPEPLGLFIGYVTGVTQCAGVYPEATERWSIFYSDTPKQLFTRFQLTIARHDEWKEREANRAIHPSVLAMLEKHPIDTWSDVAAQFPHVASDGKRLAYTRSAAHGVADRQTVTTAGKYLRQHWPDVADDVIRDVAALFTPDGFEIYRTTERMVHGVQAGPKTCMKWEREVEPEDHPYASYAPENGWALAVRISGGRVDGRALVHEHATKGKVYVRSFCRCKDDPDNGRSYSDTALEAWLDEQGYHAKRGWPSYCQLDVPRGEDRYPYIDGDSQTIDDDGYIDDGGEYECTNTDGSCSTASSYVCDSCENRMSEDDSNYTYYGEGRACEACLGDYICVKGRHGEYTYVSDGDAVEVDDEWYHDKYIGDNGIVELHDGDYAKEDECVEIDGEWYPEDDDDVVFIESLGEYRLLTDGDVIQRADREYDVVGECWQCQESDEWYSDDDTDDRVEVDGEYYHRDNLPVHPGQIALDLEEETETPVGEKPAEVVVASPPARPFTPEDARFSLAA